MFTIRNLGGVSLFLFGTTFLWLTPAFASRGVRTDGVWWAATQILALLTVAGFTVATWGLFHQDAWWEPVALGSALVGLTSLVPYWIAAARTGETSPWFNVAIHVVGVAGVVALLVVPQLEHWVNEHVMGA
jgi:uncharacterized membrane protein YuzA (DUF378 family)